MKSLVLFLTILLLTSCRTPRQEPPICEHPQALISCNAQQCRCLICNATWDNDSICIRQSFKH